MIRSRSLAIAVPRLSAAERAGTLAVVASAAGDTAFGLWTGLLGLVLVQYANRD